MWWDKARRHFISAASLMLPFRARVPSQSAACARGGGWGGRKVTSACGFHRANVSPDGEQHRGNLISHQEDWTGNYSWELCCRLDCVSANPEFLINSTLWKLWEVKVNALWTPIHFGGNFRIAARIPRSPATCSCSRFPGAASGVGSSPLTVLNREAHFSEKLQVFTANTWGCGGNRGAGAVGGAWGLELHFPETPRVGAAQSAVTGRVSAIKRNACSASGLACINMHSCMNKTAQTLYSYITNSTLLLCWWLKWI